MSGKPYRSSLIPYEDEILNLRRRKPPMPYAQIAELLRQKYQLSVCRETIFKFLRVRSAGRKVYSFGKNAIDKKSEPVPPLPAAMPATTEPKPRTKFRFTPSNRYNLTRLPPDEAAAIRKKLEEEGH